jgi:hypothetical protein
MFVTIRTRGRQTKMVKIRGQPVPCRPKSHHRIACWVFRLRRDALVGTTIGPVIERHRPGMERMQVEAAATLQTRPGDGHARADGALFPDLTDGQREEFVDAKASVETENDQRLFAERAGRSSVELSDEPTTAR